MKHINIKKTVTIAHMLMTIVMFIFTLGYFTNFLQIRSADRELYDAMQAFNQLIFKASLALIVGAGTMFAFDTQHSDHLCWVSKGINSLNAIGAMVFSAYVLSELPAFKAQYSLIDVEDILMYFPNYKMSTFTFEVGTTLAVAFIVSSLLLIGVSFFKSKKA